MIVYFLATAASPDLRADQVKWSAPPFSCNDLTGRPVSLDAFKGKIVLIVFWAPWCVPCRDELPGLDRLYARYRDKGLVVIGISVENSPRGVSSFLKKVPVAFPVAIDVSGHAAEAYRVTGIPTGFLVDRSGFISRRYSGFDTTTMLSCESEIAKLLGSN